MWSCVCRIAMNSSRMGYECGCVCLCLSVSVLIWYYTFINLYRLCICILYLRRTQETVCHACSCRVHSVWCRFLMNRTRHTIQYPLHHSPKHEALCGLALAGSGTAAAASAATQWQQRGCMARAIGTNMWRRKRARATRHHKLELTYLMCLSTIQIIDLCSESFKIICMMYAHVTWIGRDSIWGALWNGSVRERRRVWNSAFYFIYVSLVCTTFNPGAFAINNQRTYTLLNVVYSCALHARSRVRICTHFDACDAWGARLYLSYYVCVWRLCVALGDGRPGWREVSVWWEALACWWFGERTGRQGGMFKFCARTHIWLW